MYKIGGDVKCMKLVEVSNVRKWWRCQFYNIVEIVWAHFHSEIIKYLKFQNSGHSLKWFVTIYNKNLLIYQLVSRSKEEIRRKSLQNKMIKQIIVLNTSDLSQIHKIENNGTN